MENELQVDWFGLLAPASFVYALVYTFCMYENNVGIAIFLCVAATILYVRYVLNKAGVAFKKDSIVIILIMGGLGVSTFLTGNSVIHVLNRVALFFTLIIFLIHNIYDDRKWGFVKMIGEIMTAICGAFVSGYEPLLDGKEYFTNRKEEKNKKTGQIILGLVIGLPCALVLGILLATADAVFANLFTFHFAVEEMVKFIFIVPAMAAFGFFASYCGMRFLLRKTSSEHNVTLKKHNPVSAITFTSILSLMYVVFSAIQIVYLFLGFGKLPNNMTYASYARTGFFQLLFVVMVNIFIVLMVKSCFEKSKILHMMLYLICACTFVMIASSAYRMLLYIGAYQLTFLRVFVLVALGSILFVMLGIVCFLKNDKFPLFRYTFYVVSVFYLAFSLSHVDYWIASFNLSHMTMENEADMQSYMAKLSTDAAPVIEKYIEQDEILNIQLKEMVNKSKQLESNYHKEELWENSEFRWYYSYLKDNERFINNRNIRKFNLSNYMASQMEMFQNKNF